MVFQLVSILCFFVYVSPHFNHLFLSSQVRWHTKPIERRSLYVPSQTTPQGVLELWVDIMKPEVASAFPPEGEQRVL